MFQFDVYTALLEVPH